MRNLILPLIVCSTLCQTVMAEDKKTDTTCSKDDSRAITIVVKKYLDEKGPLSADKAAILDKHCFADYAVAGVSPRGHLTDDAMVYLHKVKYQWGVIGLGTSFDEDFLEQIPTELQKK